MAGFLVEPLQDMVAVGAVEADAARIWFRSELPGTAVVRWEGTDGGDQGRTEGHVSGDRRRDGTASIRLEGLRPDRDYRFEVVHRASGREVGCGRFRTAPAAPEGSPERVAFALLSCNMPFDDAGRVAPAAVEMLRAADRRMSELEVRFFLTVGDQMYTDHPARLSLYDERHLRAVGPPGRRSLPDCTPDEALGMLHDRYRRFWNVPAWKELHAGRASYPIWDDHEIVDNWGSQDVHEEPRWRSVLEASRRACFNYQLARVLPPADSLPETFDYQFDYGNLSFYVLDLRTKRRGGDDGRAVTDSQFEDLVGFLQARADRPVVFLVLSVPLVHLPRAIARAGRILARSNEDFSDRWGTLGHLRDRDRLLDTLRRHCEENPRQRVVLLSGDIHIGCVHELAWEGGTTVVHQVVSSAITNEANPLLRWASERAMRMNRFVETPDGTRARVHLMDGRAGRTRNPYRKLNFALVEVETEEAPDRVRLRFTLHGHDSADAPAFESDWVSAGRGAGGGG